MKSLHFETSTAIGGVCLVDASLILGTCTSENQKSHSEFIHPAANGLLEKYKVQLEDLDFFGCGIGPGSFTGIRVSVGAVKAFACLLNKPIVAVTTLETLVTPFLGLKKKRALAITNAYKNMVYYGLFDVQGKEPVFISGPGAVYIKDLDQCIDFSEDFWLVGDGYNIYSNYLPQKILKNSERPCIENLSEVFDRPLVQNMAKLAELKYKNNSTKDWSSILPLYIRESEAEEQLRGIKIKPL